MTRRIALLSALTAVLAVSGMSGLLPVAPAHAEFGLREAVAEYLAQDGSAATQAGSHPSAVTIDLSFYTRPTSLGGFPIPEEQVREIAVSNPAGLVGDPTAVPRCPTAKFFVKAGPECPDDTAVGFAESSVLEPGPAGEFTSAVYNLPPPKGAVAEIGFATVKVPVAIDLFVNPNAPHNVIARATNLPQISPIYSSKVTLWGDPASPIHDGERGACVGRVEGRFCPVGPSVPNIAFLRLPTSCSGSLATNVAATSWQGSSTAVKSTDEAGIDGCEKLAFSPTTKAEATSAAAESPSGLDFDLEVSDPSLLNPAGRSASDIEKVVTVLPKGMTTNPSVANGLSACSRGQYEAEAVKFEPSQGCPDSSKVGSVSVASPLLEETLEGSIYVARQQENEFGSLLALYVVIRSEKLGILVRQAGKIEPDPQTGQLTATFSQIPQLPFSDFHLHFVAGQRAPLITPSTCGEYPVTTELYPYAQGVSPVQSTAVLLVNSSPGGGPCAPTPGQLPSITSFSAGTTSSAAGAYSPFVLNLSRPDGSQQLSRIKTTLPVGLLGKLAGIPYCPESGLAQAASRTGEGEGAKEIAAPSCPASSQVGTVTATSGAGSEPLTVTGNAYLAGPYEGAPLSLEIITPAIAGPFDLGVVAVRTALQVDPLTAQITAESDPIPTILHGLPLDLRSISIDMDRPSFTLNPTSCEPKAITGSAISTLGNVAPLSQYFQASNCAALKFKPTLKLSLKGQTKRVGHPALRAVLTYPKGQGYANIGRAQVNLPHAEFIDQSNLNNTCTKPVLLVGRCPASTVYGKAKAWSPLIEAPLSGNVYLVGGFGYKLPALVAELDGQIRVLLVGKIDTGPNGGIRNTFEAVPDAPVEKFELSLKGGKKYSLIENSENLCKKQQKAIVRFTAQSGAVQQSKPVISVGCRKGQKGKAKHRSKR